MMKQMFLLLILLTSSLTHADTIELSNGKTFEGVFSGRDGDNINFKVDGINMSFKAADVKNIAMGGSAARKESKTKTTTEKPAKKSTPKSATLDAGTSLTIKLGSTLDSGKHATGHKFSALLEGNLSSNGAIVAPAGSKVYGVISESVKARRLAGSAKIMITLTEININGAISPISTSAINALTESTGKSTAGRVGRAAAIGALADGSDGAKTGAKIGLGVSLLRGGNQVVVPAGTLLDFKLTAPLKVK
ncbi:hypothetical protein MNBD_GAMMA08-1747 [hydrothermal vent metagenome]|uniref:Uncharacterized protein n=1 Tax=hydrothermal vent metagenome TaxID=652676 RepID=A0A3B0XAP5_9ZZZZ